MYIYIYIYISKWINKGKSSGLHSMISLLALSGVYVLSIMHALDTPCYMNTQPKH